MAEDKKGGIGGIPRYILEVSGSTGRCLKFSIMLAHSEWRLEHFLFGRIREEIIRKTPCSILLIKEEPGKGAY